MPKKKSKNSEDMLISKVSKVLNVSKSELLKKDDFSKIEGYDSLKHLEIITELDKVYGKKISNISKFNSIKKIIKQLKK